MTEVVDEYYNKKNVAMFTIYKGRAIVDQETHNHFPRVERILESQISIKSK